MKVTEQNAFGTDTRAISYEYDVFDLRVITHNLSVSTGLAVRTAFYIWDGQQLALQFSDGDGAGPNAPTFTYRFLNGPRIDQVLTQEGTSSTHWLLADHLGTTREVLDNSGNLVRHYVFDAYGNLEGTIAHTRIFFAGRELDSVTGLYYVRARWYDPSVGRWISEDPIGFSGGDTNLARYVGNSPVNYTDASGLIQKDENGKFKIVRRKRVILDINGKAVPSEDVVLLADDGTEIKARRNVTTFPGLDADCHGTTFLEGEYWVGNDNVDEIIKGDGYEFVPLADISVGDVVIYVLHFLKNRLAAVV